MKRRKMNREVAIKICAFAMDRYGVNTVEGERWRHRMYWLSPESIAKLYFQEFCDWEDYREKDIEIIE